MLLMGRFQSKHKEAQAQYEKFKDKFGDGKSPFVGDTDDENEEYKDGASSEEEEEEEGEEENEEEMETYEVAHTPAFNRDVNQINSVPVNGAFTGLNDILTRAFQPNDNNAGFNIQNFFQGATHRPQSPLEEEVIPKDSPTRLPPMQSLHRQNTSSLIEAEETGYAQHPGEMPMSVASASTFAADTSIYSQISPEASLFNLRTPRVSQNVVQNPMHNYYQNEVTSHSQIDSVGGYPEPEDSRAPSYVSMSAGSESRNQFPPPLTPGRSPIENMLRKRNYYQNEVAPHSQIDSVGGYPEPEDSRAPSYVSMSAGSESRNQFPPPLTPGRSPIENMLRKRLELTGPPFHPGEQ
ncbi:histone H3.v1-like [Lingula anatina]|uniref:Histone H3.v1-like n=1 Tax=Lingula anatina TaxID=7574 RepID=A0A1S3J8B2_LINAN|nr:histone H3.v1-like [Lingula anatina]|eukprot:XP_013406558.1 histone H3.v1-like [Lingula anatina]